MAQKVETHLVDKRTLAQASEVGLRYTSDIEPGLRRRRHGKHFRYHDRYGVAIKDQVVLARIAHLAIPPAYTDVWICASERGHLQATGRDARGRKQYRYHARWRSVRDRDKFARVVEFAERLPKLRRRLQRDLKAVGLGRDKVLAVVVSVMAQTLIRIGNAAYESSNNSYGLTTLHKRHVAFAGNGRAIFRFRGKGGLFHEIALDDARLTRLLRRCRQLPGQPLFQYTDDAGARLHVDSGMVNDYLREAMGEEFTAKDFRTWGGTRAAIAVLANTPLPATLSARTSSLAAAVKTVAAHLRNTPAVCRSSYIHPLVFESWSDGSLHRLIDGGLPNDERKQEIGALRFLRQRLRKSRVRCG
jgi:DNA topoisomerase-1